MYKQEKDVNDVVYVMATSQSGKDSCFMEDFWTPAGGAKLKLFPETTLILKLHPSENT